MVAKSSKSIFCILSAFILLFACSSSVFPQETDIHPRRLGIKDIEVVSQFKNGYAWVKTKDIYKKELRKRNLQSIGVVSTNVKQQATTNNGVLMGQDSLVYFDYPFDSCMHEKVAEYVIKLGHKPLTRGQIMVFMLGTQQEKKVHLFNSIIPEREWDY